MKIPKHIIDAVNALLAPYGETYSPSVSTSDGYLSMKDAAKYLGVSKAYFYRLVTKGTIPKIKLTPGVRGKAVYSKASLDSYIAAH